MVVSYPACFYQQGSQYSVIFPDLNVSTCGDSLDEAMAMAIDCLAGDLYGREQDGTAAPAPSSMAAVDPAAVARDLGFEPGECFVNLVAVDVAEYARKHFEKSVKKTLTIPAWLNTAAQAQGVNFSQVLQEALKAQLHLS